MPDEEGWIVFLAHMGFAAAPATQVVGWWHENRGFRSGTPDLRWLLAGAVLPDLVDKAVGQILFKTYFQNGRIFMHTFIVSLGIALVGVYRWRRAGDGRVLLLWAGVVSHLVLDRIWTEPTTAFWPALGPFMRHPSLQSLWGQILDYVRSPLFWVEEAAGGALLVTSLRFLGVRRWKYLEDFLRRGTVPELASPTP